MDTIFINGLSIQTIVGINSWEREKPQEVVVSVWLYTEPRSPDARDEIQECIDYGLMAKKIRALVEAARRFTIEALAEDISQLCLKENILKVRVRIEKVGAVPTASSVGVEIERPKQS